MKLLTYFGDRHLSHRNLKRSHEIDIDSFSIRTRNIVLGRQVHGNRIKVVKEKHCGAGVKKRSLSGIDGLITNRKNVFLGIKTADCVPILLWDENREVVCALHAGRVGIEKKIVNKAVKKIRRKFRCDVANIKVKMGPAICEDCYEVDRSTFERFVKKTGVEQEFYKLDLKKVIRHQLLQCGLSEDQIEDQKICTRKDKKYYSYREDKTQQRQISLIGMK